MTKQVRRSNVAKGILVPLGNGFSLAIGKHPEKTDDIDIGPNNKNGLSVNHGEILQQKGNSLRVFSAEPMLGGESPVQLLYGGMAPDKVFAMQEQYKDVHRINDDGSKYVMGGNKENIPNATYNKLSKKWKSIVNTVASKIGVSENEIEKYFNEGRLNPAIAAYYNVNGRVRENDSPTKEASEKRGDSINRTIYGNVLSNGQITQSGKPNLKYAIPYLEDKEIIVDGVGRVTTNALDSLAKYAKISKISLQEAFGLYGQETKGGAIPYGNVENIKKSDSNEKQKETKERNRALFNLNYAREYGWTPAEYTVRDFEYNRLGHEVDRSIPPLQHAFDYFKKGKYNPGDKNHTKDVLNKGSQMLNDSDVKKWISESEYAKNAKIKKQFGGQTTKQSLGERPNAKFGKEMNKRKNALNGSSIDPFMGYGRKLPNIPFTLTQGINGYLNPQFKPIEIPKLDIGIKSSIPKVDPFMGTKPVAASKPSTATSSGGNKGGINAKGMDWIGGGIQMLGNLAAAGIQQAAINNMKVTPHQYTLINPVKLKTKVNIAPQVAAMRDTVSKLTDAARRTSASSRTMYQKTMDARRYGDQQISGLLGEKENKETALINQDRLNQQTIAEKNANRVMDTINGNADRKSNLEMEKSRLTANNWIGAINNQVGIIDGPQGIFAKEEARRSQAANLAMMSMAYPDAAKLMQGDRWTHAFDGYYDMLNSRGGRGNGWRI